MPTIRLLLLISLSTVLITACDLPLNPANEEELELTENPPEVIENPCLETWAINRMKEHIKERAEELITAKYSAGAIDPSLLYGAEISFDYISQPTTMENGDLSCSAKVIVSYLGNQHSTQDLASTYAKLVNTNIEYNSNPFANIATGYSMKQELGSLGINEFNINEFSDISGNKFATQMEYELKTTHSENGDKQQSYQAAIGRPAAMLATIALLDNVIQKNKKSNSSSGSQSMEEHATKADSYYEDDYMEHVEGIEDTPYVPVVVSSQKRQTSVNEDNKVKERSAAQPAAEEVDLSAYEDSSDYPVDDDVVVVEEPAY